MGEIPELQVETQVWILAGTPNFKLHNNLSNLLFSDQCPKNLEYLPLVTTMRPLWQSLSRWLRIADQNHLTIPSHLSTD